MTIFEYTAGIFSIVLGLAVANVLTTISEVIRYRKRAIHFWVHSLWCVTTLFMLVATWWAYWRGFQVLEDVTVIQFFIVLILASTLFIASRLLKIDFGTELRVDIEQYFFEIKTPFFICLLALMLPSSITGLVGVFFSSSSNSPIADALAGLTTVALAIAGALSSSRTAHGALAIAWIAVMVSIEVIQGGLESGA